MGGSVGVESASGSGSTFLLRLPLRQAAASTSRQRRFHAHGARALVVEDIEYNARALAVMLGMLGFKVEIAVDGREALARLTAVSYQVVFLDCDLPGATGADVARFYRATEPKGKRTLIVATTALSTVEDREACMAAGMDAFITKPITPEKLNAVLTGSNGSEAGEAPAGAAAQREPGDPALDLKMIKHLSGGTPEGMERELSSFLASLDEAVLGITKALSTGSRPALSSAAHRVLSHARMVGATSLTRTAADLQEFATAYSEVELADEIALLARRSSELRAAVEHLRRPTAAAYQEFGNPA
jgi:CheY-like chemotaxis protein